MRLFLNKTFTVLTLSFLLLGLESFAQELQWERIKGPYGGSLWAGMVTSNGDYFTGTGDGRILKKSKDEETWSLVYETETGELEGSPTILSFLEHEGILYAGDASNRVLVSKDLGETWTNKNAGLEAYPLTNIRTIFVTMSNDILIGTTDGIFKKNVDGTGEIFWESIGFTVRIRTTVFSIAQDQNGTLYAGTGIGIYRSLDNGATWEGFGFDDTATVVYDIAIKGDHIYIATSIGLFVHRIDEASGVWSPFAEDVALGLAVRRVQIFGTRMFAVINATPYYSDDGVSWIEIPTPFMRAGFAIDRDQLLTLTFDGVWRSSLEAPSVNPELVGSAERITLLKAIGDKIVVGASGTKLFKSGGSEVDNQWEQIFTAFGTGTVRSYGENSKGLKFINLINISDGSPAFGFTTSPSQFQFDATQLPSGIGAMHEIFVTHEDSVLIATNQGIYYFNNKTQQVKPLSPVGNSATEIFRIVQDDAGKLYAQAKNRFYVSSNFGETWQASVSFGTSVISKLVITGDKILVATDKGAFYMNSPNGVITSLELPSSSVSSLAVDHRGHLYAISDKQLYYAESADAKWNSIGDFGSAMLSDITILDNYIYVSSSGGLFKSKYSELASIELSGLGAFDYDGSTRMAQATSTPADLTIALTYNGVDIPPSSPGFYQVKAHVNENGYVGIKTGSIYIRPLTASVTIQSLDKVIFDGQSHPVTVTTDPPNLNIEVRYNNLLYAPFDAGSYVITAKVKNFDYAGTDIDTLIIEKSQQIIAFEEIGDKLIADGPVTLVGQSSSGLPVSFNVSEGPAIIQNGNIVFTGEQGKIIVNAVQNGNHNFYAANTVTREFNVWQDVILGTENDFDHIVSIYPQPSDNVVTISFQEETIGEVSVVSITGKNLIRTEAISSTTFTFDTSSLEQGIYLLRISMLNKKSIWKKLLIAH